MRPTVQHLVAHRVQRLRLQPTAVAGVCAQLWVSDDGSGMDAETLRQIFDTVLTTTPVDEGSGLGLTIVNPTVVAHGGAIHVEPSRNQGSRFDVCLPTRWVSTSS